MNLPNLTAVIEKEGSWYVATCPELGVASQGRSFEEAVKLLPVPNHSEIARGTLKSIIQQSQLLKSEFMR